MDGGNMDLFAQNAKIKTPLADRMRPRTLDEFIGQRHIIGKGRLLRRAIETDTLQSSIFWGPPGCGKTTLASIVANSTGANFIKLNAVTAGVKDVREVISDAEMRLNMYGLATYLLLDECHRWSKAQSDSILPALEKGIIRFIGSTTENPMVSMTGAIVSRCRLFQFYPLDIEDIKNAVVAALEDSVRGLGAYPVELDGDALEHIAHLAKICFLTQPFFHRHSREAAHNGIVGNIIGNAGFAAKDAVAADSNMTDSTYLTGKGNIVAYGYAAGDAYMSNNQAVFT